MKRKSTGNNEQFFERAPGGFLQLRGVESEVCLIKWLGGNALVSEEGTWKLLKFSESRLDVVAVNGFARHSWTRALDNVFVTAFDYVEGTALRDFKFRDRKAALLFCESLAGVMLGFYGQYPGSIHGDIHPGNIIVTKSGRAHVIDCCNRKSGSSELEIRQVANIVLQVSGVRGDSLEEIVAATGAELAKAERAGYHRHAYAVLALKAVAMVAVLVASLGAMYLNYTAHAGPPEVTSTVKEIKLYTESPEGVGAVIKNKLIVLGQKTFEIGDEMEGGKIVSISLESIELEDGQILKMPPMQFLGEVIRPTGQCAIYPGFIKGTVGYFACNELEDVPRGTIEPTYQKVYFPVVTLTQLGEELRRIGISSNLSGSAKYAVGALTPKDMVPRLSDEQPFVFPVSDAVGGIDVGPFAGPTPVFFLRNAGLIVRGGQVYDLLGKVREIRRFDTIVEIDNLIYATDESGTSIYDINGFTTDNPIRRLRSVFGHSVLSVDGNLWFVDGNSLRNGSAKIFKDVRGNSFGNIPASLLDTKFALKAWSFNNGSAAYIVFQSELYARRLYGDSIENIEPLIMPINERVDFQLRGIVPIEAYRNRYLKWFSRRTVIQGVWNNKGETVIAWGSPLLGAFTVGTVDANLNVTAVFRGIGYPLHVSGASIAYAVCRRPRAGADRLIVLLVTRPDHIVTGPGEARLPTLPTP